MRFSTSGMLRGLILAGAASLLAACGGGGGGSGGGLPGGPTPANEYKISLRADRTSLPINASNEGPGIGVDSPYTTTLYVRAYRGNTNDPIPGGEDIFGCNLIPEGLEYGALYYLDGDPEHEVEIEVPGGDPIKVPGAFRAVSLDSNAGGASFHFHAGDKAGTATITCSVFDPQSRKNVSTSTQIQVGQSTGKVSQVRVNRSAPNFLFAQNTNGTTQLVVQAELLDEAGQRVPDPAAGVRNVYARIVPSEASPGARLRAGGTTGTAVFTRSINGQAEFALISGDLTGSLLVEVIADRSDNNLDNGVAEAVGNIFQVTVVRSVAQEPLSIITETELPDAVEKKSYATVLEAEGGVPDYKWLALSDLPSGLRLSSEGVITGTPSVNGDFRFVASVTDSSTLALSVIREFAISIEAAPIVIPPVVIQSARLSDAEVGKPYVALLTASGGTPPYVWGPAVNEPDGLTVSPEGVVSGTPAAPAPPLTAPREFEFAVTVTDSESRQSTGLVKVTLRPAAP